METIFSNQTVVLCSLFGKMDSQPPGAHSVVNEILPKAGLVYSEKGNLSEVLCKMKIMPLKSAGLEKMEQVCSIIPMPGRKKFS